VITRSPFTAPPSRNAAALLRQMERDGQRQTPAFDPLIVSRLRERLGLA
jgi:hypothetical protein